MKLNQAMVILKKIKTESFCPKCQKQFDAKEIDLRQVSPSKIEFLVCCPSCEANVSLRASLVSFASLVASKNNQLHLNTSTIQEISKSLKNVQNDIENLL